MMIPDFLMPPAWREARRKQEKEAAERERRYFEDVLVPDAVDWSPDFKRGDLDAQKKICFKASTYTPPPPMFDSKPVLLTPANVREPHEDDVLGPVMEGYGEGYETQWVYRNAILPRGEDTWIRFGNAGGTAYFDGAIVFPVLYEYKLYHTVQRKFTVWMSHTPMEVFSQRQGIKHCSGKVCIGGYGLGWFLEQVAKKRSVKEIVIVEKSRELLTWFARKHARKVQKETGTKIKVVCADVYEYLAKHHDKFDKIALDVFESYGNNNAEDDRHIRDLLYPDGEYWRQRHAGPLIDSKKLWVWGSVKLGRQGQGHYY